MAEQITGLTAAWLPKDGIQLKWTAATDVTVSSSYQVYVLEDADKAIPNWVPVVVLSSNVSRSIYETVYSLSEPITSYLYQFPKTIKPINSYAFSIVHVDSTGASSTPATISVFNTSPIQVYGPPHLKTSINIDSYGQFAVNPQDSYEEVSENVSVVLGTIVGGRPTVPGFGIPDLPLNEINAMQIQSAVNRWEPRANAIVSLNYDNNNHAYLSVKIKESQGTL